MIHDPRMTPADLDEDNIERIVRHRFGTIAVDVRARPNFLTVEFYEQGDPEPTVVWIAAADLLSVFAELGKKIAN